MSQTQAKWVEILHSCLFMEPDLNIPTPLTCWKCGESLSDVEPPIGLNDTCKTCQAELHVCKMCEFYDPQVSDSCREPIADSVSNKERANFCGYFKPKPSAHQATDRQAQSAALAQLDALFGDSNTAEPKDSPQRKEKASADQEALQKLNDLFGSD